VREFYRANYFHQKSGAQAYAEEVREMSSVNNLQKSTEMY
jgi:hypothetical protein